MNRVLIEDHAIASQLAHGDLARIAGHARHEEPFALQTLPARPLCLSLDHDVNGHSIVTHLARY